MLFQIRSPEAYTNPNLTTWVDDFKQPFPKNSFMGDRNLLAFLQFSCGSSC